MSKNPLVLVASLVLFAVGMYSCASAPPKPVMTSSQRLAFTMSVAIATRVNLAHELMEAGVSEREATKIITDRCSIDYEQLDHIVWDLEPAAEGPGDATVEIVWIVRQLCGGDRRPA